MANNVSSSVIPGDIDNLALCAIITVLLQMTFYVIACTCKVDTVTDFAGSGNFVILAALTYGLGGIGGIGGIERYSNPRRIIVTAMVLVWGIRLASYLLLRIIKIGRDQRFNGIRENPLKFLLFWVFQILWVYIVSLPVIFTNSPSSRDDIGYGSVGYIGLVLFTVGFLTETIADLQKFFFRLNPSNKGKFCRSGLWKLSRHPNYLGEIVVWWGVFFACARSLQRARWIGIISPLFVTFILMFFTGIPPLERASDKKYGNNPDYIRYKKSTPPLIPAITTLYRITPYVLKLVFCCEFPIYNFLSNDGGDADIDRVLEEGSKSGSNAYDITPWSSSYSHSVRQDSKGASGRNPSDKD